MATKRTRVSKAKEETPVFSFDAAVKEKPTAPKAKSAPKHPTIELPEQYAQGMKDFLKAKELESEAKSLKGGEAVAQFTAYAYDTWLDRGVSGSFSSTLRFSSPHGDLSYIGTKSWKKITSEDDANYLRKRLGEENFDEMVDTKTTLTGDLAEVQEQFNQLVKAKKIDPKTAQVVFQFLVETFVKQTTYEFKKDAIDWHDLFGLADGDADTASKVLGMTLSKKPYFKG